METTVRRKLICAVLTSIAGVAHAQSSVTIYGLLNNGLQYQTGLPHGNQISAVSGYFAESRLGFLGSEDLGGGTRANFRLEMGLDTQNGSYGNGGLFGRAATVGISNESYGTFKMGNLGAYELSGDSYDVDPQKMLFYSISTVVRGRNFAQTGSGLEYTSPRFGGLTLKGQYDLANSTPWNGNGGFGSGPGQLGGAQGRSDGIKAQFETSSLQLLAIYDEIRDPHGQFSNVYVASRSILVGGSFAIGPVKISAGAQHLSAPDASNEGYFGSATPTALPPGVALPTAVNHEWLGAAWQITPFAGITGAVYHANANNGNGNATLYTLSGTYNLSKRTLLFTEIGYVHNSATSNIGLGNGYSDPYGANINNDPINGDAAHKSPNFGHGQFGAFAGISVQF
jgi:predicted porin